MSANKIDENRGNSSLDSLQAISKKHNIPLSNSVIEKLNAEQVIETGEFEVLDSARLSEIGINYQEDRIKVLKLVKLSNSQELWDLRKRYNEAQKRSEFQSQLFCLHQEKISLIIQFDDYKDQRHWWDKTTINTELIMDPLTSFEALEHEIEQVENFNLEIIEQLGIRNSAEHCGFFSTNLHYGLRDLNKAYEERRRKQFEEYQAAKRNERKNNKNKNNENDDDDDDDPVSYEPSSASSTRNQGGQQGTDVMTSSTALFADKVGKNKKAGGGAAAASFKQDEEGSCSAAGSFDYK